MRALVLTHAAVEGPGFLAQWLPEVGLDLDVVELWSGAEVPELGDAAALISMGGPQQAYDDTSAPWLRDTKELLATAVARGVPVLGVCLGAQLLAEATGGRIAPGADGPELGPRLVGKKDVAGNDPLFWDLPLSPVVMQWHWDAIEVLPPGATLLMSSPRYPHQAFRVGDAAWGIQFHVETPLEMVRAWADEVELDTEDLVARAAEAIPEIEEVWGEVVRRFGRLAVERATS